MFSSRFYLRSILSYKRERCDAHSLSSSWADLPGVIVILEKLPVFIHKREITGSDDLARPESFKMIKPRRINKFIGCSKYRRPGRVFRLSKRISFSRCLPRFARNFCSDSRRSRFFMNKSYYLSADETVNFGWENLHNAVNVHRNVIHARLKYVSFVS